MLLVIVWILLAISLLLVTAMRPSRSSRSRFELERRGNPSELRRERLLSGVQALLWLKAGLLIVLIGTYLYTRGAPGYPNGTFDLVKLAGPGYIEGDRFADEANVGSVRSGAAVGTTGHVDRDSVATQAELFQLRFHRVENAGQGSFRFGDGQSTGGPRGAGDP